MGQVGRISPEEPAQTPEFAWLGMPPSKFSMSQGPIITSALGFDPPDSSLQFAVEPMHLDDSGVLHRIPQDIPGAHITEAFTQLKRLNTPSLTALAGQNKDHALVWEGKGEFHTTPPVMAACKSIKESLPQGDKDWVLHRWIEDSVSLTSDLEFNHRRADQQLLTVNCFWPWGQGFRAKLPNLALRRGDPTRVISSSLRLAGLARLTGYRPAPPESLGTGVKANFAAIVREIKDNKTSIVALNQFQELLEENHVDEAHWLMNQMDSQLLAPILELLALGNYQLHLLAGGKLGGVRLNAIDKMPNDMPFDERALEEKLPILTLHECVDLALL